MVREDLLSLRATLCQLLLLAAMLAPTPVLAVVFLTGAYFWGNVATVAVFSAVAEVVPPAIRARLAGLNTLGIGLFINSFGPFAVGYLSDTLFPYAAGIRWSLAVTVMGSWLVGASLIMAGMAQFRQVLASVLREPSLAQATIA